MTTGTLAGRLGAASFVIRTRPRAAAPPTYFGAHMDRAARTGVFVFDDESVAVRVARGLETHHRQHGRFPAPAADALHLGDPGELDLLDVRAVDAAWLAALVDGSGVMLCTVTLSPEGHARVDVAQDRPPRRAWFEGVFGLDSPEPRAPE